MALRSDADADEFEWTDQRFLNLVVENDSIKDSTTRVLNNPDPEKFPTLLSQLPNNLRTSNGDGIVTALGRPISVPELVRLTKLSSCVTEKKDVKGLLYRLELNTTEDGRNYLYRLGVLEDGNSWSVMSKVELFNLNSLCAPFITLKGVCLRTLAIPAKLSKTSDAELRSLLSALYDVSAIPVQQLIA